MLYSQNRMSPDHARTGETHDFPNLSAVDITIAMNGTAAAGWFVITKRAFFQTLVGVFHEILTIRAQPIFRMMMCPAVHADHDVFCEGFSVESVHCRNAHNSRVAENIFQKRQKSMTVDIIIVLK